MHPQPRFQIRLCEARPVDPVQDAAAGALTSTSHSTPDFDTPGGCVELLEQSAPKRDCASTETTPARETQARRDRDGPRLSYPSGSSPRDAGQSPRNRLSQSRAAADAFHEPAAQVDAISSKSSEWLTRHFSARSTAPICVRWRRKATACAAALAPDLELDRPRQPPIPGARSRPQPHPFERVQMRLRAHPISIASRTPAAGELSGHLTTGGTPMHRLK